jgi:conjugative transfer signal peptidase TraF
MVPAGPPEVLIRPKAMRARQVLLITLVGLILAASSLSPRRPLLIWNASPSVPVGLYRVETGPIRRGDLVLVRPPPSVAELAQRRGYLSKSAYLIKVVAATGGDRVCRFADRIFVGGVVARALVRDRRGRSMPSWRGCRQLGPGDLFLLAPDTHSFDSRYFGVVPAGHLVGRAVPLWLMRAES